MNQETIKKIDDILANYPDDTLCKDISAEDIARIHKIIVEDDVDLMWVGFMLGMPIKQLLEVSPYAVVLDTTSENRQKCAEYLIKAEFGVEPPVEVFNWLETLTEINRERFEYEMNKYLMQSRNITFDQVKEKYLNIPCGRGRV